MWWKQKRPWLLSVESPLLSVGRRPLPLEAERAGDLKCVLKGGGGGLGGVGASEGMGHPPCTAQQRSDPGLPPRPPVSATSVPCVVKVAGVARIQGPGVRIPPFPDV